MLDRNEIRIESVSAEGWIVRNGWEQAQIFVRNGHHEPDRGWVSVSIMSSFGSWGYHWNHIGPGPWWKFLASLDRQYAMQKFMGNGYHIDDYDGTVKGARERIIERRRWGELSKAEARDAWSALDEQYDDIGRLLDALCRTAAFRDSYYELPRSMVSPQASGFWTEIWRPWIEAIASSAPDRAVSPGALSPATQEKTMADPTNPDPTPTPGPAPNPTPSPTQPMPAPEPDVPDDETSDA